MSITPNNPDNNLELVHGKDFEWPRLLAILFAKGEPVSIDQLAEYFGIPEGFLLKSVREIRSEIEKFGLTIIRTGSNIQLLTRPEFDSDIKQFLVKIKKYTLSSAQMEVLALIAYKQPITRVELETARGVGCETTLQTLLTKNIIKVIDRSELPGRPYRYGTTNYFLELFGLAGLHELPSIDWESALKDAQPAKEWQEATKDNQE